jgi:hypothetical protein
MYAILMWAKSGVNGIQCMNLPPEFEWLVEKYCTKEESCGEDNSTVQKSCAKIYSISR